MKGLSMSIRYKALKICILMIVALLIGADASAAARVQRSSAASLSTGQIKNPFVPAGFTSKSVTIDGARLHSCTPLRRKGCSP